MAYSKPMSKITYRSEHMTLAHEDALFCEPCELDNKQEPAYGYCQTCAERLCEECYRTHKRPAPTRNHVLLDKFRIPKSNVPFPKTTETCAKHDGKPIEYFCRIHNTLGCLPCVTIIHRNCDYIYINEIARDFESSEEYKRLMEIIEKVKKDCKIEHETATKLSKDIKKESEFITKEVRNLRKQIDDNFNKWEEALHKENFRVHEEEERKVQTACSKSMELMEMAEQLEENLKMLQRAGNKTRLYIQAKNNETALKDFTKSFASIKQITKSVAKFSFVQNSNTSYVVRPNSGNGIGRISRKSVH